MTALTTDLPHRPGTMTKTHRAARVARVTRRCALAALAALPACRDVLDTTPQTFTGTTNFYQTPAQMERAVLGAYAYLQSAYGSGSSNTHWILSEMRSDNTTYQLNESDRSLLHNENVDEFLVAPDNNTVRGYWNVSYAAILQSNVILGRLEPVAYTDQAAKDRVAAEAKFLRALHYFNLVRFFGDVPLLLKETTTYGGAFTPTRAPVDSVYAQIIRDLTEAAPKLPTRAALPASQAGRATQGAATTLLADVYMTRKNYQAAATALQSVVGMGYTLATTYDRAFDPAFKNGPESIFEVQFSEGVTGEGSTYVYRFVPFNSGRDLVYGFTDLFGRDAGWNIPTRDMVRAYEPGDARRAASIGFYVKAGNAQYTDVAFGDTIPYIAKYRHPFAQQGRTGDNWPVYRYAEALLLYAEALNELGRTAEAYPLVNQVRARAGLAALASGLSQTAFRDAVAREQRVESAFEDKRWFELLRTGRAVDVMNAHGAQMKSYTNRRAPITYNVTAQKLIYPIPIIEITNNGYPQNPGY